MNNKEVSVSLEATVKIKTKPIMIKGGEVSNTPQFREYIKTELVNDIANELGFDKDEITIENLIYKVGE